jgi:hypothetical protein
VSRSVAQEGMGAALMREWCMNTAPRCYSESFDVAAYRAGLRIRNDEVVGSIPTSSTNLLNYLPTFSAAFDHGKTSFFGPFLDRELDRGFSASGLANTASCSSARPCAAGTI